jgi:hypothetical protein
MATKNIRTAAFFFAAMGTAVSGLTSSTLVVLNTLMILGTTMTKADIISKLKSFIQLNLAVVQTKQAYTTALAARTAAMADMHGFYKAFSNALIQALGPTNAGALPTFGVAQPKVRTGPSAETLVIAQAKSAATRKARGQMGKAEKEAITATPQPSIQVLGLGAPAASSTTTPAPTPSASSTPASSGGGSHS